MLKCNIHTQGKVGGFHNLPVAGEMQENASRIPFLFAKQGGVLNTTK